MILPLLRSRYLKLKSDHFGIEIILKFNGWDDVEKLKSDHFGIEIDFFLSGFTHTFFTKIRPFWD
mgnify:CR=1 FL=1